MFSLKKVLIKILKNLIKNDTDISTISDRGVYSTTETYIGTYNERGLYRRIYTGVQLTDTSEWTYPSSLVLPSDYYQIIRIRGVMVESDSPYCTKPVPYYEDASTPRYNLFMVGPEETNLGYKQYSSGQTITLDLIVEYIK